VRVSTLFGASRAGRSFTAVAALVLAVAAFNLFHRLNREIVTEWDESLYAISAAETARHGNWVATTFDGELDYYNTKPPLNVWLIAAAFKAFGVNLVSLRLASATAAWLTILVLMLWARRAFGTGTAVLAGLILATTHGFIYVHSGRSANTDALFTLMIVLTAISLWTAERRRWALACLGPILAAVFMLRGMAVLLPLAMVAVVVALGWRSLKAPLPPLLVALVSFALPVGAWAFARYQVDGWQFLSLMFHHDFIARSASVLEGHEGRWWYYANVLQKDQYEWLALAVLSLLLFPVSWRQLRGSAAAATDAHYTRLVMGSWLGLTLVVPTLMRTKVAWYLNPFFPLFAVMVARLVVRAFNEGEAAGLSGRRRILAGCLVLALAVAEGKLIYYSYARRDVRNTVQGLLLAEKPQLAGHRVFKDSWWNRADRFVLEHVVGAVPGEAETVRQFKRHANGGDFFISAPNGDDPELLHIRSNARHRLCRRRE